MNEILQKHGCSNVFTVPEGLRELMSDISREVLREQPPKIFDFIANYLSALLITREHGVLAVKIMNDLCDCRPSVSEHLIQLGFSKQHADELAQIIKQEIEDHEPLPGKENLREVDIIMKVMRKVSLDEDTAAKVCQVTRNAYRDYWYRKKALEQTLKIDTAEPWEIAAAHTIDIYKQTKPSFADLTRATQKIQAAYRGYYVRRNMLRHLKSKKNKPKEKLPGPPLDIADSREIDLGPVIALKVRDEDVTVMFQKHAGANIGLNYDPTKTITHTKRLLEDEMTPSIGYGSSASQSGLRRSRQVSTYFEEKVPKTFAVQSVDCDNDLDPNTKISFAKENKVFIDDDTTEEDSLPLKMSEPSHRAQILVQEILPEIPEDIIQAGYDSDATASVPTSGAGTARNTDPEDIGEDFFD